LPVLVGGSLVIERIFTIPGMGMLMFDAIARRDYPVVMGVVTLVAVTTQLAVLAGDLMLGLLDPRLRLPGAKP
jgi:peptide/nickel transport system permease protein